MSDVTHELLLRSLHTVHMSVRVLLTHALYYHMSRRPLGRFTSSSDAPVDGISANSSQDGLDEQLLVRLVARFESQARRVGGKFIRRTHVQPGFINSPPAGHALGLRCPVRRLLLGT